MQLIAVTIALLMLLGAIYTRYLQATPTPATKALSRRSGTVLSVCKSSDHVFSKQPVESITLIQQLGVDGDCHLGTTVQHRSRLHIVPPPLNLRQVHLIHSELFSELGSRDTDGGGCVVRPGDLGENITTEGLDLLRFGAGTRLHFLSPGQGSDADDHPVVRITGLRNPCRQIHMFRDGLQERCLVRDDDRNIVGRKAGVMSVVEKEGVVTKGATIVVEEPEVFVPLICV